MIKHTLKFHGVSEFKKPLVQNQANSVNDQSQSRTLKTNKTTERKQAIRNYMLSATAQSINKHRKISLKNVF